MVTASEEIEEDVQYVDTVKVEQKKVGANIVAALKEMPPSFSLRKVSQLPRSSRLALDRMSEEPQKYEQFTNEVNDTKVDLSPSASCCVAITFTDEDLQLGSRPHNRLLFVSGYIKEQKVSRILIDGGSAVNIMPKFILKILGVPIEELARSRLVIQGFNQGGQRAFV
jgi:hypothetical protein